MSEPRPTYDAAPGPYTFALDGRFKPYVRMTQRGKWVKPQAQEYIASKAALGFQMRVQMAQRGWDMLPGQTPLCVKVWISPPLHNRDLDNEVKALLDAAQGVVFPDDRWVDRIEAVRVYAGGEEGTVLSVEVANRKGAAP